MLLILAFVGLTTGTYPITRLEIPVRRCRGRQVSEEYVWQEKPAQPPVRPKALRRPGRCVDR
jgi:hypothetical protein